MTRAFVATAVLMLALAPSRAASVPPVPLPFEAATNSAAACATPRTMAAVRPSGKSYELVLTVENPGAEPLALVDYYFFENMLDLRAVPSGESNGLALIVPLLSPGPRPLIVAPFA